MVVTVTETCSKLRIIEYIVVICLNDILVSATIQQDGSYQIISASFDILELSVCVCVYIYIKCAHIYIIYIYTY
jgi:hypothetical protein